MESIMEYMDKQVDRQPAVVDVGSSRSPAEHEILQGHSDLINLDRLGELCVLMVGAGSIGSFAAVSMAKMGIKNFEVFDFDTIELHNFANQLYSWKDVGLKKIAILGNIMSRFGFSPDESSDRKFLGYDSEFTEEDIEHVRMADIVICAVDNMATRKLLWELSKKCLNVGLFIDCRIGGLQFDGFALNPLDINDRRFFEQKEGDGKSAYLYESEEAAELKCTEKSIIFPVLQSASWITTCIFHYVNETMDRVPLHCMTMSSNPMIPSMMVERK